MNIFNLVKTISLDDEPMLEKWARLYRYTRVTKTLSTLLQQKDHVVIFDMGCGQDILFYKYLELVFPQYIDKVFYVGIDPLIFGSRKIKKNVYIIKSVFEDLSDKLSGADMITMFAVLEHVDDPNELLHESMKRIKKGGGVYLTTPSFVAKPVLEFLSYGIGYISKREIDEHKNYFSYASLTKCFEHAKNGLEDQFLFMHTYFELFLNNFVVVRKK